MVEQKHQVQNSGFGNRCHVLIHPLMQQSCIDVLSLNVLGNVSCTCC